MGSQPPREQTENGFRRPTSPVYGELNRPPRMSNNPFAEDVTYSAVNNY